MQRLDHPNVVKAIAVPPDLAVLRSKLPLMCMEFCSKGDLRQVRSSFMRISLCIHINDDDDNVNGKD